MNEKNLKKFIKQKIKFTQSLLIMFFITGRIIQAVEIDTLEKIKEELQEKTIAIGTIVFSETKPLESYFEIEYKGETLYYQLKDSNNNIINTIGTIKTEAAVNKNESYTGNFYNLNGSDSAFYKNQNQPFKLESLNGDFIGNTKTGGTGAAVFIQGNGTNQIVHVGNITSNFIGNTTLNDLAHIWGGAMFIKYANIGNITGNFINNSARGISALGGAFYASNSKLGDITGDFIGNNIENNGTLAYGGAFFLQAVYAEIKSIQGDFIGNYIISNVDNAYNYGGAIHNQREARIGKITGDFIGNSISSTGKNSVSYGGAIYNDGAMFEGIEGDFIGNSVSSDNGIAYGGAIGTEYHEWYLNKNIYNGNMKSIVGNFINNSAITMNGTAKGGAIYNGFNQTITIGSKNGKDTLFEGNTIKKVDINGDVISEESNAIHNEGILNLLPEEGTLIIFNDKITGMDATEIGVVKPTDVKSTEINIGDQKHIGTVVLNEDMSGYEGIVNFNGGTIKIGTNMGKTIDMNTGIAYNNFFKNGVNLTSSNVKLDLINGIMDNIDMSTWNFNNNIKNSLVLYTTIEVNLETSTADTLSNLKGDSINISDVIILNPDKTTNQTNQINIGTGDTQGIKLDVETVYAHTPIHQYTYNLDLGQDGTLILENTKTDSLIPTEPENPGVSGYNPEILKTSMSLGAYASNYINISDRILNKDKKYNLGNSIWLDTYGSNETLKYKTVYGENDFDNSIYITSIGYDKSIDIFPNIDEAVGIYFGNIKSTQEYENKEINQNGYYLGATLDLYKKNSYINLTALGSIGETKDKINETEKFDTSSISIGMKVGRNYNILETITLKPSITMGYHNISSDDHTNSDKVLIKTEKLNVLNIKPEIKIEKNLNNLNSYLALGYNLNSYSNGKIEGIYENKNYSLPMVEIKNYLETRIGVSKSFKENSLNIYGEIIGTDGDKKSLGYQVGFKWSF